MLPDSVVRIFKGKLENLKNHIENANTRNVSPVPQWIGICVGNCGWMLNKKNCGDYGGHKAVHLSVVVNS